MPAKVKYPSKGHKGGLSKLTAIRRYNLVRAGKASWLRPQLLAVNEAIEVAGI